MEDIEYEGQVLGVDETKDIAVLSICCGSFESLRFSARGVELGQEVVAIGYALGLEGDPTVTRGVVSGIRYSTELNVNLIQTDAPINRGNSGGPMLSMDGLVVGMNASKISGAAIDAVGFAIVSQAVMLTAPALVSTDVVTYKGQKFVRKAGPSEILIGSGDELISFVQAKDFVAEVRVVDPAATIAFAVAGYADTLQPEAEMIAAGGNPVVCVHRAGTRSGEFTVNELVPPKVSVELGVGDRVRAVVIRDTVEVFIDDELLCSTSWTFGRVGVIRLIGIGDADKRYGAFSIWVGGQ